MVKVVWGWGWGESQVRIGYENRKKLNKKIVWKNIFFKKKLLFIKSEVGVLGDEH